MVCPMCGEELTEINGELTCVSGEMWLSPKMRPELTQCFVEKTRTPKEVVFSFRIGGTWFCPGCGIQMEVNEGRIICPGCSRSLNEFYIDLIERHPHRLDPAWQAELDRWWAENRRKAPTWPRKREARPQVGGTGSEEDK